MSCHCVYEREGEANNNIHLYSTPLLFCPHFYRYFWIQLNPAYALNTLTPSSFLCIWAQTTHLDCLLCPYWFVVAPSSSSSGTIELLSNVCCCLVGGNPYGIALLVSTRTHVIHALDHFYVNIAAQAYFANFENKLYFPLSKIPRTLFKTFRHWLSAHIPGQTMLDNWRPLAASSTAGENRISKCTRSEL